MTTSRTSLRGSLASSALLALLALAACDDGSATAPGDGRDAVGADGLVLGVDVDPPDGVTGATDASSGDATAVSDGASGDATSATDGATRDDATDDATSTPDATTDDATSATSPTDATDATDATGDDATSTPDAAPDVPVDPCVGPDSDGDGVVDACDPCPEIPRVLVYDVNSERRYGRAALDLLGCDYTVAAIDELTSLLASGAYGAVVLDMPDARPEGAWTSALLDFVAGGGAVVMSSWRLDQVPGPSPLATMGASLVSELTDPRAFTPTWVPPLFTEPFDLGDAALRPGSSPAALVNGATLAATAGRVWARFEGGGGAIVESNGGRTFLDGFLWDDYPEDTDGDSRPDMAELVANQLSAACRARLGPGEPGPTVLNLPTAEVAVVPHDLLVVRGFADDADVVTSRAGEETRAWPTADRRWKALFALAPGDNWLALGRDAATGPAWTYLQVRYEPQTNPERVRFVYALASDGDGRFDAPPFETSSTASAQLRIGLGARLIQAMFADRLAEAGLERRTFRLEPGVTVWRTALSTAAWWGMNGLEMFSWIWGHLSDLPACASCRTVVILGMTHWDDTTKTALAHTALGGGGLAIFGSGTLHTWAETLDDVPDRLADETDLTALGLFDDSGYRQVAWANYATGLGAVLHELGHALDLPHPVDAASLMNRGFDHVNRLLVTSEPPSAVSSAIDAIWPLHEPTFDFAGVHRLRWHRALALVARSYGVNAPPSVTVDASAVHIHSAAGIRVIAWAIDVDGDWRTATGESLGGDPPSTDETYALDTLRFLFPSESRVKLMVTDDQGNMRDDVVVPLQ